MHSPPNLRLEPVQDKLNIFVSSRIQECKDERKVTKAAVLSVNHSPFLFEHLGARSYSPRRLYISRLLASQIMIAIYRDGYGWIDAVGGMTISGLEDEYQEAKRRGIPMLVFVHADDAKRDDRLKAIIADAGQTKTLAFYKQPDDLTDLVRDGVTAEIARLVLSSDVVESVLEDGAFDLLKRIEGRPGGLVDRTDVVDELQTTAAANPTVCVHGPPGSGKTTLLAQYAVAKGAIYVRVQGLAPKDIFTVCAQGLKPSGDFAFATLNGAQTGFASVWADSDDVILLVDECDYVDELLKAVNLGGGTTLSRRIIFSAREAHPSAYPFPVPAMASAALTQIAGLGNPVSAGATPLTAQQHPLSPELPISPKGREVLAYLALTPLPLTASDLLALLNDPAVAVEQLYDVILTLDNSVEDTSRGFRLLHEQYAVERRAELAKTPQRLRFYVNRLVEFFAKKREFRHAFQVAKFLGEPAVDLSERAFYETARLGDWKLGVEIAESLLAGAQDRELKDRSFMMMLSLTYPMETMGNALKADELIASAGALATDLGAEAMETYRLVALESRARRTLASADVEALLKLHGEYLQAGENWDAARLAIDISALLMSGKRYEDAVELLRPALATFKDLGDEPGIDFAERNLASALSGIGGNEPELDTLLETIEARGAALSDNRRQRAWTCNLLTRRYRTSGRLVEAEAVAREAISLSAELGDEALRAVAQVNLGNVLKDQERPFDALEAYDEAANIAQRCGRKDLEADGSRLRAGILNDFDTIASKIPDRHAQAIVFARHAIGLLEGSIYYEALGRSYIELADAERARGRMLECGQAWFKAAEQFKSAGEEETYAHSLLRGADALLDEDAEAYVESISPLLEVTPNDVTLSEQFLDLLQPLISKLPQFAFIRILGRHLQAVRSHIPQVLRPVLLERLTDALSSAEFKLVCDAEPWRATYAGISAAFLSRDNERPFTASRLARAVSSAVGGLDVRETPTGNQIWTAVVDLEGPLTITVEALDESRATTVAVQSLAMFLHAFGDEFKAIVGRAELEELYIQVLNFGEAPADIQTTMVSNLGTDEILATQPVAVTRPTVFDGSTPTLVVLSPVFLQEIVSGGRVSGSLQLLLGLTAVEVVHQLLRGQVEEDEIRPKVISLIRNTLS